MQTLDKKQILIAGGSKPAQLSLLEFFPRDQYDVTFASAGGETVFRTVNGSPDLLIMDPSFSDMSGPDVISKIRDFGKDMESVVMTREVPIIVIHGAELDPQVVRITRQLHVAAIFCRPLVRQEFLDAIKDVISGNDDSGAFNARTILVVEPEPRVRTLYQNILSFSDDIEIIAEGDCAKALEQAAAKKPDLVISEQQLPDMTGVEFVRKLREAGQAAPVIMVAATDDEAVMAEAKEAGAEYYVKKPFKVDELRRMVLGLLEQSAGSSAPNSAPEPAAPTPAPAEASEASKPSSNAPASG